jgi:hypothetical protein
MAQFVALDPNVEVNGAAILATIGGMEEDVMPLLEQHGIADPKTDQWYPQQAWLDVFKEISEGWGAGGGMFDLVSIGMNIPDNAIWPPDIDTVESALKSIDVAYHMNHRGGEIGHYRAEVIDQSHIRMICDNPYPSDFDYGIIYRTTQKFISPGTQFTVSRAASPCRLQGDEKCIYDITWG